MPRRGDRVARRSRPTGALQKVAAQAADAGRRLACARPRSSATVSRRSVAIRAKRTGMRALAGEVAREHVRELLDAAAVGRRNWGHGAVSICTRAMATRSLAREGVGSKRGTAG